MGAARGRAILVRRRVLSSRTRPLPPPVALLGSHKLWLNPRRRLEEHAVIDPDGYRPNVGIVLLKDDGRVFWARRVGRDGWQFPQGGMRSDETPIEAMYRELEEETGLADRALSDSIADANVHAAYLIANANDCQSSVEATTKQ